MMIVSIIAAVSEDWIIGRNGKIPWHYPSDFKHFKKLTDLSKLPEIKGYNF